MERNEIDQHAEKIAHRIFDKYERSMFDQGKDIADRITDRVSTAVNGSVIDAFKEIGVQPADFNNDKNEFDDYMFEVIENVVSELGLAFLEGFSEDFYFPVTVGE